MYNISIRLSKHATTDVTYTNLRLILVIIPLLVTDF